MANEVQVRLSLTLIKGNMDDRPNVTFNADMDTAYPLGPTPGAFIATVNGVDVDLSQLTTPGWCVIKNLDETNYVAYGVRDPETDVFYYFGELGPGEGNIVKLSRNFGEEESGGPGTATTAPTNVMHIQANTAPCNVYVGAYER